MPRGKRTVFSGTCTACGRRTVSLRLHKQDKKGRPWKEFGPTDKKYVKYCRGCKKRTEVKLKEERHSSK